jgi:thiol-disulfide isomerase/thioredoxin
MNIKTLVTLLLICVFASCCATKQEPVSKVKIKFEGDVDPNTLAVVTLQLKGETVPGTPRVVLANNTYDAFFESIGLPEYLQQIAEDKWVSILAPDESYVIGWIVKDNKMFGYCSEPFVASNNLEVTFSPGMPVCLEYDLTKPVDDVNVFPAIFLLTRKALRDGKVELMSWGINKKIEKPEVIKIDGLAQGTFQLYAQALQAEDYLEKRVRFLYDKRFIDIKSGTVNRIEAEYPLLDTTVEDGDVTIRGLAHNSAGEVLPKEKLKLIPFNDEGPRFDLYYPEVITDSNGSFEFKGVRPDTQFLIKGTAGSIVFKKNLLTKGASLWVDFFQGKLNLQFFPDYETPAFDIYWKDGQKYNLQEYFGQIIVVNIWASWCAPCQKVLTEFNSIAKEFQDNKDIVFAAVSVDYSRKAWENAVEKSGLDALHHGWFDLENPLGFNRTIPYSLIIDKKGILLAEGINLDIREEIKKALEKSK